VSWASRVTASFADESDGLTSLAVSRLQRAMGERAGARCAGELLAELSLREIRTPVELLRFATCLTQRGGVMEVVGSTLKVVALLRGAEVAPS